MAYGRKTRRSSGPSRARGNRGRSGGYRRAAGPSRRRAPSRARGSSGARTVRIVIEQAPSNPVATPVELPQTLVGKTARKGKF